MDIEFLPLKIKNIPLFFSLLGIFLALFLNQIVYLFNSKKINNNNFNLNIQYPQKFVNII